MGVDDVTVQSDNDKSIHESSGESSVKSLVEFYNIADEVNEILSNEGDTDDTLAMKDITEDYTNGIDDVSPGSTPSEVEREIIPNVVTSNNSDMLETQSDKDEPVDHGANENVTEDIDTVNDTATHVDKLDGEKMSISEETMEQSHQHGYNLSNRSTVNYKNMHRFRESKLMQLKGDWTQDQLDKNGSSVINKKKINMNTYDLYRRIVGVTLTQMSKEDKYAQVLVKEGMRGHSERAIAAVLTEFTQLNNKQVFRPRSASVLTANERKQALNLITMVKDIYIYIYIYMYSW